MTRHGMISDAEGDIAALVYAAGDHPDQVLLDFARHVSDSGRRICSHRRRAAAADAYEVSAYKRIEAVLKSGKSAWVYVKA